jgi:uncharacterized protein YgiM (DUF1202 family)
VDKKTAIVNDDAVNLRNEPTLQTTIIGSLRRGEHVVVKNKTLGMLRIGSMIAPWYEITTAAGRTGWVYGFYLSFLNARTE